MHFGGSNAGRIDPDGSVSWGGEIAATVKRTIGFGTSASDLIAETKRAMEGRSSFLAAKVTREYTHVERIRTSALGIRSGATVILEYAVEYPVGFDLRPGKFRISADRSSITVNLDRPQLAASPAVRLKSWEVAETSFLIDEKAAVIALQARLTDLAQSHAGGIRTDEAVVALCERRLSEFLREFLSRQAGMPDTRDIRFEYPTPSAKEGSKL
jgi:hypothetical protein